MPNTQHLPGAYDPASAIQAIDDRQCSAVAHCAIPSIHSLYRAHVAGATSRDPDLTVFVEADSWAIAVTKISEAISAMERRPSTQVAERIYNCHTAEACIEMGESTDLELRLFEIGWQNKGPLFAERPVFLVLDPAPLWRKWLETQPQMRAAAEVLDALTDIADLIDEGYSRNDGAMSVCLGNARSVIKKAKSAR